jgi:hypothetical protein
VIIYISSRDCALKQLRDPRRWTAVVAVRPWCRDTIEFDRERKDQIDASIDRRPARPPADPAVLLRGALTVATMEDADLFRAFAEIIGLLELPGQVMARPGLTASCGSPLAAA